MKPFPKPENPFSTVGYIGPDYFCDREEESKKIQSALINGRNITLIARRRIGKSALLQHVRYTLESAAKPWKVLYIDLLKTASLPDLYKLFAEALYHKKASGFLKKLSQIDLISRLRLNVSFNPLTQLPEIAVDLKDINVEKSLGVMLDWVAEEKNVLVVFDEFQQIISYPETTTEGFLRSEMMRLPGLRFIFCGSNRQLLEQMFRNNKRPFFNSTQIMSLAPIPADHYSTFIQAHFKKGKRSISNEALQFILHVSNGETHAVQKICNIVYESGIATITLPIVHELFRKILFEQQLDYDNYRRLLKPDSVQFRALRAIARYEAVFEPNGTGFMQANGFTNSSSVLKALKSLESYGLISRDIIGDKGLGYFVDDAFFKAWLNMLPK